MLASSMPEVGQRTRLLNAVVDMSFYVLFQVLDLFLELHFVLFVIMSHGWNSLYINN